MHYSEQIAAWSVDRAFEFYKLDKDAKPSEKDITDKAEFFANFVAEATQAAQAHEAQLAAKDDFIKQLQDQIVQLGTNQKEAN